MLSVINAKGATGNQFVSQNVNIRLHLAWHYGEANVKIFLYS